VYVEICGEGLHPWQEDLIGEIIDQNLTKASKTTLKIVKGEINLFLQSILLVHVDYRHGLFHMLNF